MLAVDGSEHSLAAAHLIRDLPLPPNSEVTALAVLTPRHTPGRAALLAALDEVHAILLSKEVDAKTGLLHGHPAEELTNFANEHRPDLMVVGAKGLRATLGILLGGVAQQVVEYAQWPVLVVRSPYAGLWRVLLVTDGSPHSQRAVDYLTQFPLPAGAEVRAMHVLPPLAQPDLALMARPMTGVEMIPPLSSHEADLAAARQAEVEEREGQALLAQTIETLKSHDIGAARHLVRGDAATEIIEHVKSHEIDLVVAGSRGLSAIKGWWLGSVSRKLVHYAGCSVLIVK
jgi:nucleotide-binding universal stress UspA family protein